MDKVSTSGVFEAFNKDIIRFGSHMNRDHMLKLYVLAEDRHISALYSSASA